MYILKLLCHCARTQAAGRRRSVRDYARVVTLLLGYLFMTTDIASAHNDVNHAKNAYDYSFYTLVGHHPMPLASYRGKVLLIVNVASHCGFTRQYASLEKLYETYKDQGLVVLGVPSNDFGGQEPGSSEEIATFCQVNYGVTFPMTSKEVVSGKQAHPFYVWAKQQLGLVSAPKWNFHKYLINRNGELVDYFYSTTAPDATRFINAIEKCIHEKGSDAVSGG